jgi:flavin reductase (DIM6/NTAB) family NADH-FMN oxidoreductase RutF
VNARPSVYVDWESEYRNVEAIRMKETFQSFPSAVVAVAAVVDGTPTVMIATSFTVGVSYDPPMCMFAAQKSSTTWPLLSQADCVGISILGTRHQAHIRQLGSRKSANRLDGIDWTQLPSGAITLYDAPMWLECSIASQVEAGDHHVVLFDVIGSSLINEHEPLIYHNTTFGTYIPR